MRKIIEITPEFEKVLVASIDTALKNSGISVMQLVQTITSAIKTEEDPQVPPVTQ
jgi:hypothetical protein